LKSAILQASTNASQRTRSFSSNTANRSSRKNRDKGVRRKSDGDIEVVQLGNGITESDLVIHDAHHPQPSYAFLLSHMEHREGFPTPHRRTPRLDDLPRYEDVINQQIRDVQAKRGTGDLAKLLRGGDTWRVESPLS